MYRCVFKRLLDIMISLVGFIAISPLFIVVWIGLAVANKGGGAFFTQLRPGRGGVSFRVVKFKTMSDKTDSYGKLLPNKDRLTSFGLFLRKTSLDEIPQLLNVIKGDMSLVGPRPLLPEYLSLYNETQRRRHDVRPGITGWAQVNGRNAISWGKKFELDVYYIDNLSFVLDLKILFLTIKKVLIREGISSKTSVTMERFTGNN